MGLGIALRCKLTFRPVCMPGTVVAVPQQFFSPISTRSFRAEAPAQSQRIPMKAFWVSGRNSPEGLVAEVLVVELPGCSSGPRFVFCDVFVAGAGWVSCDG